MKFSDIPLLHEARLSSGGVHWDWRYLEQYITREESPILLEPDYQRGRVWTEAQQIAYVEYCLRGGKSGRTIYLNCKGWSSGQREIVEVVDGLQRITAARRFMANDLPVFNGVRLRDLADAQARRPTIFEVRRMEFQAAEEIGKALGIYGLAGSRQ